MGEQANVSDANLCKAKIHIKGMDTLDLYAEPDSPILAMLREQLAKQGSDEMIYLNYGEDDQDSLYFMASDLVAIETEPVAEA